MFSVVSTQWNFRSVSKTGKGQSDPQYFWPITPGVSSLHCEWGLGGEVSKVSLRPHGHISQYFCLCNLKVGGADDEIQCSLTGT